HSTSSHTAPMVADAVILSHRIALASVVLLFFFFNDPPTPEIYTLSLHDALPISVVSEPRVCDARGATLALTIAGRRRSSAQASRSEEHTSELQSPCNLVCRLLLEKKKNSVPLLWRPVFRRFRPPMCCVQAITACR